MIKRALCQRYFLFLVALFFSRIELLAADSLCVTAPPGLVAWWRAEGNALDSVQNNNGILVGNTAYGAGRIGQGFVFDGQSDLILVGNFFSLQLQDFTIEAWVERTSTSVVSFSSSGNGAIVDYGFGGYGLYLN